MSDLRLRPGDRLGAQSVQGWVCTDALGERYETIFGSTTHALDACVPPAGAAAPTLADYRAFVARVSHVRHPCVVRYITAGESAPRPGAEPVPWLRGEHQEGASASILDTPLGDAPDLPRDEDGPRAPTFGALLRAAGGRLSPKDRDALLGDVLEGLAHLHSLGLPCGHLDPDEIALGHIRHRSVPVARLRVYAWPGAEPADPSADLLLAAPLFRAAIDASAEASKPREAEALATFAEALAAGVFATADEALGAFAALCDKWGRPRKPREADAAEERAPAPAAPAPEAAPARGHHRRHRDPSSSGSSEVARRLMALFRILLIVAFIVGVGVAVYFYLSASAEAERRRLAAMSGPPVPAILVIPTERAASERLAELPGGVFDYTPDQLAVAAAAEGDPRAPAAAVRAALESLDAADAVDAAAFDAAAARVAPALPALRAAAETDPAAGLLLGRALLLGLGAPQDVPEGYRLVLKAALDGLHDADLVFGDLLASDVPVPDLRAESRVERDRRAVSSWRRAAGPDAAPSPRLFRLAADRIAPMLRSGRGIPPMNNDYPQWLGRAAAAGHVPSLVALSTPGGFAPDDPTDALKWLRVLARLPSTPPPLRAWAQLRMAGMFERGEGVPEPDTQAALTWYRRAADGGNGEAMLALADRLRKGAPEERAEAAAWRKRAAAAKPVPEIVLRTVLVEPPASVAQRARAANPAAKPVAKPAAKPTAKPGSKLTAKPAVKPAAKPVAKPAAKPKKPAGKHAPRPAK